MGNLREERSIEYMRHGKQGGEEFVLDSELVGDDTGEEQGQENFLMFLTVSTGQTNRHALTSKHPGSMAATLSMNCRPTCNLPASFRNRCHDSLPNVPMYGVHPSYLLYKS